MTEKHAVRRPQGEGHSGKQLQVSRVDLAGAGTVGGADALAERGVEIEFALGDESVRGLREFMIARKDVDLTGVLAFERGEQVEELVRFVAARGGHEGA